MKVLVTGVAGQSGHDIVKQLDKRGHVGVGSNVRKPSDQPLHRMQDNNEAGNFE